MFLNHCSPWRTLRKQDGYKVVNENQRLWNIPRLSSWWSYDIANRLDHRATGKSFYASTDGDEGGASDAGQRPDWLARLTREVPVGVTC